MLSPLLFYGLIKPLSLIPLGILYKAGDLSAFLLHSLFRYRRKVVRQNLERSFPGKKPQDRRRIEKNFYRHLGELIAESIKFFSIDEKKARKMLQCRNPELPNRFYEKGRSVILVGGHYNNWELYALASPFHLQHRSYALYKPLRDRFFDRVMRSSRERFGLTMVPVRKAAIPFQQEEPTATVFATDQSPPSTRNSHWMTFLDQETPVMKGVESFARKYEIPVIFGIMHRKARGRYEVEYQLITEDPTAEPEGWITEAHTEALEEAIRRKPEHWLWSHRRWKKAPRKGS